MKLSCNVAQDLLPLYCDGICSEESRVLVEEHTRQCQRCQKMLADLQEEDLTQACTIDDSAPLRSIQSQWSRAKARSFRKGILFSFLACVILICVFLNVNQWYTYPVPTDLIEITGVSQDEAGDIHFHLFIRDNKNLRRVEDTVTEDGVLYLTPVRSYVEGYRMSYHGEYNQEWIMTSEAIRSYRGTPLTAIYVGPVGEGILIWEAGMELPSY